MTIRRVKIRLLTGWAGRRKGHVFPLMDVRTADILIGNNRAEYVIAMKKEKPDVSLNTESSDTKPATGGTPKRRRRKSTPSDSSD